VSPIASQKVDLNEWAQGGVRSLEEEKLSIRIASSSFVRMFLVRHMEPPRQ
jgi:hypothetical protein